MRHITVALLSRNDAHSAAGVAEANRFEFLRVREAILAGYDAAPGSLLQALVNDFRLMTYMLRYTATFEVGRYTAAQWLLVADFHAMRATYTVACRLWPELARRSLLEMAAVLEHFAGIMGHRMRRFSEIH